MYVLTGNIVRFKKLDVISVSYTHLDVYKRQVELNAKSLNGGFEDGDLSLQIVLHGVGHALCLSLIHI